MIRHPLFDALLKARGLSNKDLVASFLSPDYMAAKHDPYLLPDMEKAVNRLMIAKKNTQKVVIYGDYDIDGLTATALLLDAFKSFGIEASAFIPNRFTEGYGLNVDAIEELAANGTQLIVSVDCGSLSFKEVARANELGVDVIVTDHHSIGDRLPAATAVINPKRDDSRYPFIDLAGCGVAFKLVQALQQRLPDLPIGQEKWLLDLVALGTVCDVVTLRDENRINVYWGLKVLSKTRRPGLRALMAVSGVEPDRITARTAGFVLGPRMNAAGRLETAHYSLKLLTCTDSEEALNLAYKLDAMNQQRRTEQDKIYTAAVEQAKLYHDEPVLVLSGQQWSHGIVGIVAAKILERYKKPTFVLQEMGEITKGSARSFGDFSAVGAVRASEPYLIKGGGHTLAAGFTLRTDKIDDFRRAVNEYYHQSVTEPQQHYLDPKEDVRIKTFDGLNHELVAAIALLEPYGHGNAEPIFGLENMVVVNVSRLGSEQQHIKIRLADRDGRQLSTLAFNYHHPDPPIGVKVHAWVELVMNEWRGRQTVEARLKKLKQL